MVCRLVFAQGMQEGVAKSPSCGAYSDALRRRCVLESIHHGSHKQAATIKGFASSSRGAIVWLMCRRGRGCILCMGPKTAAGDGHLPSRAHAALHTQLKV